MGYALVLPIFAFLLVLIIIPAASVVWDSLTSSGAHGRGAFMGLNLYRQIFTDRSSRQDVIFTLQVTVTAVVILVPLCYALALFIHFSHGALAFWYRLLCIIPLFIPTIISAFAFIVFYQDQGVLDTLLQTLGIAQFLHLNYSAPINDTQGTGIILGSVWNSIPITVLLLGAGLGDIDNALIEAARDVGANALTIFLRIIVPLTSRQLLIALALSFIGTLGSYTIPYLLGPTAPQMLGPLIGTTFGRFLEPYQADAQAVVTFLLAALVGLTYVLAVARRARGTAAGRGV